MLKMANSTIAQ